MSSLLFLMHQALVPFASCCFVFPQYVPVPTSKFSRSSFFAVSSEFHFHSWWHLPSFASFLTFLSHCFLFFTVLFSALSSQGSLVLLAHVPLDMFSACSFNGSCYKRQVRRRHQNHPACRCSTVQRRACFRSAPLTRREAENSSPAENVLPTQPAL